MILCDNMQFWLSMLLSLLPLINAHILLMLVFIPHPQIPVEVSLMVLLLTITGTVLQFHMKFLLMLSQVWMSTIIVGSTIHLLSLQQAAELVMLISPQFHLFLIELLEQTLICQDKDLLSTLSLSITGRILLLLLLLFCLDETAIFLVLFVLGVSYVEILLPLMLWCPLFLIGL